MSFVTSCPECATNFVVRPEHLSAQRGQVRCGKCQHVFNALDRLNEPLANASTATPQASLADFPPEEVTANTDVPEIHIHAQQIEISDASDNAQNTQADLPSVDSEVIPWPIIPPDAEGSSVKAPTALNDFSLAAKFGGNEKKKSYTWLLVLLAILFGASILLQSLYFLRTAISVQWPVLKPYLVEACKQIGCEVELPKNADLLVIDDSDLHEDPDHKGLIHLTSTLINNAPYAQAYPLLELTLTDANDTPLLRRLFKPTEYLPTGKHPKEGISAGDELHINLPISAGETPVAGYRVFVSYQ